MSFKSIIYANSIAKYNSGKLLSSERIKRLCDADFSDAVKMLIDYGYGGGYLNENSYDIDVFLTEETAKLIEFVSDDCPDESLQKFLLNKYYYSDAKVYYKAKYCRIDTKNALYGNFEGIKQATENNDFSSLEPFLAQALTELNEKYYDKKPSPKDIDLIITKAMYFDSLNAAKMSKNKSLIKYIKTEIDFSNILTAFRYRKLKLNADDFINEFIDGGYLDNEKASVIINGDQIAITKTFMNSPYSDAVEKLYANEDFAVFERDAEDILYSIMANTDDDMTSYSPFINYFMAKTAEFKTIKTILVCIKNDARAQIAKRIRSLYD